MLINDLLTSSEEELVHIAHSDAYFGLSATVGATERTELLNEQLAMRESGGDVVSAEVPSKDMNGQINPADGYEWLEHPEGSGVHYMRAQKSDDWSKWQG